MSAFLGPVHFMLYNKIQRQNELLNEIINASEENRWVNGLKDKLKDGGCYKTIKGILKKYDEINKLIILEDKTKIYIDDISSIKSPVFDNY